MFSGLRATWFFAASPIKPYAEAQEAKESNTSFNTGSRGNQGDYTSKTHIQDALGVREGHVGRGGPVALIVCDDLDAVVLPHADTAVCGAKILTAAGHAAHAAIRIHESRLGVFGQLSTAMKLNPRTRENQQIEAAIAMGIRDEFRQELQTAQVGGRRAMESRVSMPIAVFLAMALKDKIHRMFRNCKTDGCRRSSMTYQVPKSVKVLPITPA